MLMVSENSTASLLAAPSPEEVPPGFPGNCKDAEGCEACGFDDRRSGLEGDGTSEGRQTYGNWTELGCSDTTYLAVSYHES